MDTQRHTAHSSPKRMTAVFSKTQRALLKRGGGTNLEIAFPDDSFSDRSKQKTGLTNRSQNTRPVRSIGVFIRCNKGSWETPLRKELTLSAVEWQEPVASRKASCSKPRDVLRPPILVLFRKYRASLSQRPSVHDRITGNSLIRSPS